VVVNRRPTLPTRHGDAGPELAAALDQALAHRGPTTPATGTRNGPPGFTRRRLAIQDLSPAGHQPMAFRCAATLVFNGEESYNQRELRARSERQGHRFASGGDTEVLLQLLIYPRYGSAALGPAARHVTPTASGTARKRGTAGPRSLRQSSRFTLAGQVAELLVRFGTAGF